MNWKIKSGITAALLSSCLLATPASAMLVSDGFTPGPTVPGKWGPPAFGTGATVSWSLMGSGLDTDAGVATSIALSTFMPVGFKAAIVSAFASWSAIADLTFVEMPDPGVGMTAPGAEAVDIRITGHHFDGPGGVLAHAFFPPVNGGAAAGDMHFDAADPWKLGFGGPGFDIFQVAAHEIGHAIGLGHTAVPGSLMNPFYTEAFSGPQADDIAGAVHIYGSPVTVPEPSSIALLGLGVLGFGAWRKRQSKAIMPAQPMAC